MHWHRAKRLLSHYPIGPNNLAGISRPGMDELKNRMCPLFEGTMLSPIRTVRLSVLQDYMRDHFWKRSIVVGGKQRGR
jgi:hypothetical protein